MNGKAASDKIFTLLDTPIDNPKNTMDLLQNYHMEVEVRQLQFAYNEEKKAIDNLSLTIKPNQLTVFVGKSGCGKSTLAALLMGFYRPQQGKILFNGQSIDQLERHDFYRKVSLVSHSSYVFKGSLRENMLMANPQADEQQIYRVLEQVNLADFVRQNGGLDMLLQSRGSNLSGGQIQRLALARALLHDAQMYIFDEATSNIDIESEEIILKMIQQLKANKTIVLISHRLANAVHAEQIYLLDKGRLLEQGDHAQLLAAEGQYAQMFNQQKSLEQIREVNHA